MRCRRASWTARRCSTFAPYSDIRAAMLYETSGSILAPVIRWGSDV
jgi:hypothetical protein